MCFVTGLLCSGIDVTELTPVLFFLVSSKETVKEAAKFGELRTSLRFSRHSPKNLHQCKKQMSCFI